MRNRWQNQQNRILLLSTYHQMNRRRKEIIGFHSREISSSPLSFLKFETSNSKIAVYLASISSYLSFVNRQSLPPSAQKNKFRYSTPSLRLLLIMARSRQFSTVEFYGELSSAINGQIDIQIEGFKRELLSVSTLTWIRMANNWIVETSRLSKFYKPMIIPLDDPERCKLCWNSGDLNISQISKIPGCKER